MPHEDLVEHVSSASSISSEEKETNFRYDGQSDNIRVSSFNRGTVTGLLKNRMFDLDKLVLEDEDGRFDEATADEYEEDMADICGVIGWIPMGSLTVKNTERSTATPSAIVSTGTVDEDTFS